MLRFIVAVIILWLIAMAILASFLAKPAGATIICNPTPTPELIKWNKKRINRT